MPGSRPFVSGTTMMTKNSPTQDMHAYSQNVPCSPRKLCKGRHNSEYTHEPNPASARDMKILLTISSGIRPTVSISKPESIEASSCTKPTAMAAPCGFIPANVLRKMVTA
uniref:Uncharacterized protein n=1 Tax=Anopheles coluzzii TaxID=1518534 RepID=A0A8W7PJC9_ANOCL